MPYSHGKNINKTKINKNKIYQTIDQLRDIDFERLNVYASSIAFYSFLSFFPALSAILSLFFLLSSELPDLQNLTDERLLPDQVQTLVSSQITNQAQDIMDRPHLSVTAVFLSVLMAFFMATMATKSLIRGLNYSFQIVKKRNVVTFNTTSFSFTLLFSLLMIGLMFFLTLPLLTEQLSLNPFINGVIRIAQLLALIAVLTLSFSLSYKFLPAHQKRYPFSRYLSGSFVASLLCLLFSSFFSFYINYLPHINRIYGTFSSIIIFLLWLQLIAFSILLGAKFNFLINKNLYCK